MSSRCLLPSFCWIFRLSQLYPKIFLALAWACRWLQNRASTFDFQHHSQCRKQEETEEAEEQKGGKRKGAGAKKTRSAKKTKKSEGSAPEHGKEQVTILQIFGLTPFAHNQAFVPGGSCAQPSQSCLHCSRPPGIDCLWPGTCHCESVAIHQQT